MPNKEEVDKKEEDGDINIGDMKSAYLFITPLRLTKRGGYSEWENHVEPGNQVPTKSLGLTRNIDCKSRTIVAKM